MKYRLFLTTSIISFLLATLFLNFTYPNLARAQESTSPTPSATPLAHLTFRTCLIPNTTSFRLSFRADYHPGEYRVMGQNSGFVLNLGYLELGQEGGGFGEDNTAYVLPYEDTWIKQWFNGTRWQRSGGLPVTSVQEHLANGYICEIGGHTSYYTPTPTPNLAENIGGLTLFSESQTSTPSPTAVPTASPTTVPTTSTNSQDSQTLAVGGIQEENQEVSTYSQVLGTSTMAETGITSDTLFWSQLIFGLVLVILGFKKYQANN